MRKGIVNVVASQNIGTGVETDILAIKGEGINYDAEIDQLATEIEDLNEKKANKKELDTTNEALSELTDTEIPTIKADLSQLKIIKTTELPIADESNYGKFAILQGGTNDRLFFNMKFGSSYAWFEFQQGGSDTRAILGSLILGQAILGT